jgi:hypothetical protein
LVDWDSLFPNGGNHATVRRDVEAFDRYLYSKWERSLVSKDTDKEGRSENIENSSVIVRGIGGDSIWNGWGRVRMRIK